MYNLTLLQLERDAAVRKGVRSIVNELDKMIAIQIQEMTNWVRTPNEVDMGEEQEIIISSGGYADEFMNNDFPVWQDAIGLSL